MNRIKYENYLGAAGYDAVARKKIKELEEKVGTGGGSGGGKFVVTATIDETYQHVTLDKTFDEVAAAAVAAQDYQTVKFVAIRKDPADPGKSEMTLSNVQIASDGKITALEFAEPFRIANSFEFASAVTVVWARGKDRLWFYSIHLSPNGNNYELFLQTEEGSAIS